MQTTVPFNAMPSQSQPLFFPLPAHLVGKDDIPWIPLADGKAFKPLRFLSEMRGYVELLRMEPGTTMPLHRHTGEVHAFNLEGSRQLCTGEIVGPGDYVYEPPGNTDTWKVVGEKPVVILIFGIGAVEYLGPDMTVTRSVTAQTLLDIYHQYCNENDTMPFDLME